ncbi:MAG: 4'-phosphopantetheinyl transferase superfamily protein [Ruminococcaceae bacterium]|nr:4'-phosphopantetheinyl transferase superfamily protein [Oscillospiraceae bacterium]
MKLYITEMNDRRESRTLLHRALRKYTGISDWKIGTEPLGKPYAIPTVPHGSEVHFSLSHSGMYWVIAMDSHPLGLDLQAHKGPCNASLVKRYFHPDEAAYWQKNGETGAVFYDIWCAKESYVKFTGEGITRSLTGFSVFAPPVPLRKILFENGYSLYVCSAYLPETLPELEAL